jgi:hypothetical protein
MKLTAISLAAVGLLTVAGSAGAAGRATDVDFLKANRCKGLAVGLGSDATPFATYIKAEEGTRLNVVIDRGDEEFTRARRQTNDANIKAKLEAELAGPCTAYMAGAQTMAGSAGNTAAH